MLIHLDYLLPKFPVTFNTTCKPACALVAPPNLSVASIPVKAVPLPTKLVALQTPDTINH